MIKTEDQLTAHPFDFDNKGRFYSRRRQRADRPRKAVTSFLQFLLKNR